MRRFLALIVFLGIIAMAAVAVQTTAQDGPPGGPGGPPPRNGPGGRGGPRAGFHLIPPFVAERMNLTDAQKKQVAELEKETKAKLYKILTPQQQKTLEAARPPRPRQGGGDRRGPGGPGGPGGGPGPDGGPDQGGPGGDQPPRP